MKAFALLALTILASAANAAEVQGLPSPFWTNSLPRHTAAYAPRPLTWEALATPVGVRAVYPHPTRAETLYALTATGVQRSDDDAATWRLLPLAGLAPAAVVTTLAFRPGEPESFCFGTRANGLWFSRDGGATAQCVGSKATGMAADAITSVLFVPEADPLRRIVLVTHGKDVAGLSRGNIEDRTWSVVGADHIVYRVLSGDPEARDFYLFASETTAPDVIGVYYAPRLDAYWQRLLSDTLPTDGAWLESRRAMCITTLDKGILRVSRNGGTVENLGGEDDEWFSAAATWGAHADSDLLALYQPSTLGLIAVTNGLADAAALSRGLYHGSFVSEDSHIRANAGGTRFYGAINGALWVGRVDAPLCLDTVRVTPAELTVPASAMDEARWHAYDEEVRDIQTARRLAPLAAGLAATLRANFAVPDGQITVETRVIAPVGSSPLVTADLSRFGLPSLSPLTASTNGFYRTTFDVTPEGVGRRRDEWRPTYPGPTPITVTARIPDTQPAGGVGLFTLYTRPTSFTFWDEGKGLIQRDASGSVTFNCLRDPQRAAKGQDSLKIDAGPGPWQISIGHWVRRQDIGSATGMVFRIRSVGRPDADLRLHLGDNSASTITPGVSLVAGGYVAGGTISPDAWRKVAIPVPMIWRGTEGFAPDTFGWVVFSGDSATRRTYLVDDIRFIVSATEWEQEVRNAQ